MFLSATEIATTREHAWNNLLNLSEACLDAGHKLSNLFSESSRDALQHSLQRIAELNEQPGTNALTEAQSQYWLENTVRVSRFLDSTLEILGEAHKALIRNAEAQVRVFDEMAFATINRASKTSPWETGVALSAMKVTLETAESTLHGMTAAAMETVDLAEHEIHQIAESVNPTPAPRKRAPARKKPAA